MNKTREDQVFSAPKAARRVLRLALTGALATLRPDDGAPFSSLVTVATTPAGEPILLLSTLAVHTKNLATDGRASLLLVAPGGEGGDPLAGARLTLTGTVSPRDTAPELRRRFLARHAEAAGYADFADFGFHRFVVDGGHLVAGFGRIVSLTPAELLTPLYDAAELVAAEEDAIAHMTADHAEAATLYATRLLGQQEGEWHITGIDPDGADLKAGGHVARLEFPERVTTAGALRRTLADLSQQARAAIRPQP
jgi:putative heme iron utilization protein